jgi:hypothetical protein
MEEVKPSQNTGFTLFTLNTSVRDTDERRLNDDG